MTKQHNIVPVPLAGDFAIGDSSRGFVKTAPVFPFSIYVFLRMTLQSMNLGWACDLLWPMQHNDDSVLSPESKELCVLLLFFSQLAAGTCYSHLLEGQERHIGWDPRLSKYLGCTYTQKYMYILSEILVEFGVLYFIG